MVSFGSAISQPAAITLLAWHITIPGEEERKFAWKN
jgi:hypothetical protein